MSTKSGLKKTFSWRFGPSKFSRKSKPHSEAEVDEPDSRRHTNAFGIHGPNQQSGPSSDVERDSNADTSSSGPNSSLPRPSPDTRSRSNLSSFRPTPESVDEPAHPIAATASAANQLEPIKLIRAKSPPPTDLETLFQRELAAKIKKRCQETQQRQLESSSPSSPPVSTGGSSTISRSQSSALPPIPKTNDEPVIIVSPDVVVAEFENPLYQTLDECYSGSPTLLPPPPPPPLPPTSQTDNDEEATYAVIEERNAPHYQTVVSGALVTHKEEEEEERVYAIVAEGIAEDKIYDTVQTSAEITVDSDAIYENLEEFQDREQTLVLDVEAASAVASASSISRSSNSSSSGNSSSSPQQSSSSSVQLSPTDSLANVVSIGSVRSISSPDSGVFGLLQPANFSANSSTPTDKFTIKKEALSNTQHNFLDQTLKQFERLEQLSSGIFESSQKQFNKMEDDLLLTRKEEKVAVAEQIVKPVFLSDVMSDDKVLPISEIPIETLLDLVGAVEPSENANVSASREPFRTYDPANEDGLFQASLVSVNSQASSSIKESDTSDTESLSKERFIRSPEPKINLGAQIVENEVKRTQERDRARNEKLGLDDVGESFDRLSSKRYDVINEMKPKTAKRKDWLHSPSTDQDGSSDQSTLQPLDGNRRQSGKFKKSTYLLFLNDDDDDDLLYFILNNSYREASHFSSLSTNKNKTTYKWNQFPVA
uniref:Uncharacterized protein n=1 Tax=Daphnia galeata TaxID=27404 RepID=A0A8J2RN72_9CRUS|nr:unnamed protein product [Daphnia galeata]